MSVLVSGAWAPAAISCEAQETRDLSPFLSLDGGTDSGPAGATGACDEATATLCVGDGLHLRSADPDPGQTGLLLLGVWGSLWVLRTRRPALHGGNGEALQMLQRRGLPMPGRHLAEDLSTGFLLESLAGDSFSAVDCLSVSVGASE